MAGIKRMLRRPQGWRPWTHLGRDTCLTRHISRPRPAASGHPRESKRRLVYQSNAVRGQGPHQSRDAHLQRKEREVPVTNRRAYNQRLSPYHVPHQGLPRLRAGGGVVTPSPIRSVNWTGRSLSKQAPRVLSQIQISSSVDTEWLTHASQFVS